MCTKLFRFLSVIAACSVSASCTDTSTEKEDLQRPDMVTYPEKGEMILHTDRAPQLETPLAVFRQDFTPNEYFFVRWHLSQLLTRIDIDTFKLYIGGHVAHPLAFSLNELKTKFPVDSIAAVAVCSGIARSTFNPKVPGTQWQNGAMGNAMWKGVKLKYLLAAAGIKKAAVDVTFQGMDNPPMPGVAPFIKSLSAEHADDGEVLVAYEMNGRPIPLLNGYPLKLVVPGWYATYWIGSLNTIKVLDQKYDGFWMTKAYLLVNNKSASEKPDSLSKDMAPVTNIHLHSVFVEPDATQVVKSGQNCLVEGLVITDGTPVKKVELSLDDGITWLQAELNPELGKYAWRRWKYNWKPTKADTYQLIVRAEDINGNTQTNKQWNRSGYARGFMEHIEVNVK
ncbi:MAG: molybdopterin-dependent oxidoreductase [Taibaiella sp.]|nr:molybdopterin-dependent oxidoreductase [Taibaiella sp.]